MTDKYVPAIDKYGHSEERAANIERMERLFESCHESDPKTAFAACIEINRLLTSLDDPPPDPDMTDRPVAPRIEPIKDFWMVVQAFPDVEGALPMTMGEPYSSYDKACAEAIRLHLIDEVRAKSAGARDSFRCPMVVMHSVGMACQTPVNPPVSGPVTT